MTDQTIPDVTDDDRRRAREWAEGIEANPKSWSLLTRTAARVILNAVPTPPRPTLEDMTPGERRACQRMQADTKRGRAIIITAEWVDGHAELIDRQGDVFCEAHTDVTPRPDLPRLEWPGDQKPAPAPALPDGWRLADHKENGRGIVTNLTPDPSGRVYFVIPADDPMGYDWIFCDPDDLTYIDTDNQTTEEA